MCQFDLIASVLSQGTYNLGQMNELLIHAVGSGFMEACTDGAIILQLQSEGNCVFFSISPYSFQYLLWPVYQESLVCTSAYVTS